MNIIQIRQEKRRTQINQIKASIEKSENRDLKQITLATSSALDLSMRTAREYVLIAFHELGIENEK